MKHDNFEDLLTEALKDYVKTTEAESVDVPKVEFSKRHEMKMEKLFKSVADGSFGDFEKEERTKVGLKNKASIYIKPAKVAVFVLLGLIVSLAIAPTMNAWLKESFDLYGDDKDEYAWVLKNDKTDILEAPKNNLGECVGIFGYLPEGYKITKNSAGQMWAYIEIEDENNQKVEIKKSKKSNGAVDMDESDYEKRKIDNIEITCIEKEDENIAIWCIAENEYQLYGKLEWNEIEKIISNIKYEEF